MLLKRKFYNIFYTLSISALPFIGSALFYMWHIALAPATAPRFYLCYCNDNEINRFKSLQDFYCETLKAMEL